jgi:PAS domain S-box-containing protein
MRMHLRPKHAQAERLRRDAEAKLTRARTSDEGAAELYEQALGVLGRSQAILEGVGDGIVITDPSGRVQMCNQAAQAVISQSGSRALGRPCHEVLGLRIGDEPLDCSQGCALLRRLEGKPVHDVEVERIRRDGREQQLLVRATSVQSGAGEVTEVVHSFRDISELKRADEAKTMFLATASHELKTPITVILGFTQAIRAGWLDEDKLDNALGSIESRAKELSRIVDRLLLTGRIESGRVALDLRVVPLRAVIDERAGALATVTERNFVIEADDVPDVIGDPQAIPTILDHLLENAVKYSPDGEDIVIRAKARGARVQIEVIDHGIGMSPDEVVHCFDRFWQAETSDVRRFGGTGVGLYIVKSMVEGMGGTVAVESVLGYGTTFTMSFTRARDGAAEEKETKKEKARENVVGKRTMIHEFMRQIGVPGGGGGGGT